MLVSIMRDFYLIFNTMLLQTVQLVDSTDYERGSIPHS